MQLSIWWNLSLAKFAFGELSHHDTDKCASSEGELQYESFKYNSEV